MDGNQIENATPPANPPVNEFQNKYEEEKRKREQMEQDLNMLREQQLRLMAAPPQQPYQPPVNEPEDEDILSMDPSTKKAVEKMMAKKEAEFRKYTEETAKKTYYKESVKVQAVNMYPQLKDGNSEFFKKVSFFMDSHPQKYNEPEGILDACARVASDMNISRAPVTRAANETTRGQVSSGSATVEGSGHTTSSDAVEMDVKGQLLAAKLGIDPNKMAQRLRDMTEGKGVYATREGKTGKAAI